MPSDWIIRRATPADAATIAHHRARMFLDIGNLKPEAKAALDALVLSWLATAIPSGEYVAFLAAPAGEPGTIVAGAGVQLRAIMPRPNRVDGGRTVWRGREAIVLNVYTEPAYRRRGLARLLMQAIMDWARADGIETVVLHASDDGRALYESMGFEATNEMRFKHTIS